MSLRRADPHTLAGAYVMDAVTPADRARFEQHLTGCEPCRQEVRGLREATARLASAVAVPPSPQLRAAAIGAVARTRQLPPAVAGSARWPAIAAGRRWLPRLALGLAGGLAAVAIALGMAWGGAQNRLDQAQLHSNAIAAVLNAPDATMLTAQISTGGTATVVMSRRDHSLVFAASGLHRLPAAETYELWLVGPAGARPAGMLPAARSGPAGPMVVSGVASGDQVGVTVEPDGGSPRPTTDPVLMLDLSSGARR